MKKKKTKEFYQGIITLAEALEIDFHPRFIMQDACNASYNAAKNVNLDSEI